MQNKLFKGTVITILITLLAIFGANAVSAADWYVNQDGSQDFTSIQDAIDDVSVADGDNIFVQEGTNPVYLENIDLTKELNLQAESLAVTIDGSTTSDTPVVRIPNAGSGTTIDGFSITGGNGDGGVGIQINNADNCFIINNNIYGNVQGIRLRGTATENTIKDNSINENDRNGIVVTGDSEDNLIQENTIMENGRNGIKVEGDAENTLIQGNSIVGNGYNGILVDESSYTTDIMSNTILDNGRNGIMVGDSAWDVNANYNRIYGHTDATYYDVYVDVLPDTQAEIMDARYNWWGSNSDPSPQIYSEIEEGVLYNPWLYMIFTANPTTIPAGSTSTLTASFNNLFDGTTVTPFTPTGAYDHIPDGTPVTFTTTLGAVGSDLITTLTANGIATATLTANEGPGIAYLTAYLDAMVLSPLTATVTVTATSVSSVSAKTVGMQTTGSPMIPLILASLLILSGFFIPRKK